MCEQTFNQVIICLVDWFSKMAYRSIQKVSQTTWILGWFLSEIG